MRVLKVLLELRVVDDALATEQTVQLEVFCVHANNVVLECLVDGEGLAAVWALKRPLTRVGAKMRLQCTVVLEGLATEVALEVPFSIGDPLASNARVSAQLVRPQLGGGLEPHGALVAAVWVTQRAQHLQRRAFCHLRVHVGHVDAHGSHSLESLAAHLADRLVLLGMLLLVVLQVRLRLV